MNRVSTMFQFIFISWDKCSLYSRHPRRVFASCPHFQDAQVNGYAHEGPSVAGTSRACLRFVRIFGAIFERVFKGQKYV